MPPVLRDYLDQIKSYSIVAIVVGLFVSYIGQFVAAVVVVFARLGSIQNDDPFQSGVDSHFWGRTILSVVVQAGFMGVAGFATAFLAKGQYIQQARDMAILCAVCYLLYGLDLQTHHMSAAEPYLLTILAVPAAIFGARKSAGQ